MMELIHPPAVRYQAELPYLGIPFRAPYRGMFQVANLKFRQLKACLAANSVGTPGFFLLRYKVIDMHGMMEMEAGVTGCPEGFSGAEAMPGIIPAGYYAREVYRGLGLEANRTLLDWIRANGYMIDKYPQDPGEAFTSRYELYLTDPKTEPRKKQWEIELSIRLTGQG